MRAKRDGQVQVQDNTYPLITWSAKSYENRIVPLPPATILVLDRLTGESVGSHHARPMELPDALND